MQTGLGLLLPIPYFGTLSDWPNRLSLGKGLSQSGLLPVPPLRPGQKIIISRRVMGSPRTMTKNTFLKVVLISGD